MRAPIHAIKHYHQMTLSTVTTLAEVDSVIIDAVAPADVSAPNEVLEGAIVKAVYVELWVIGSVSNQFFTIILQKLPSGLPTASFTEMTTLGDYRNKKNILYTTQGLASNDGIAAPIPIIRQWFKIPKGKQRFGLDDSLVLQIASRGSDDVIFCGFATYKEYT